MKGEFIMIDSEAYLRLKNDLTDTLMGALKQELQNLKNQSDSKEWISSEEARQLLNVGKTKFKELKAAGAFTISQESRKLLISRKSILKHIEKNIKK